MKNLMSTFSLILSLVIMSVASANSVRIYNLEADVWAQPRSGAMIPQLESVKLALEYWTTLIDGSIMLSYPGQDSGEIWAAELRDWMVSLGVPSEVILLSPGLQSEGELHIMVGQRRELLQ